MVGAVRGGDAGGDAFAGVDGLAKAVPNMEVLRGT
jgi:hypothetical protein